MIRFWVLTLLAILATGLAGQALAAPAGPAADVQFFGSLLLLAVSVALLVRVLRPPE